jgi:hypothetical protein
LRIPSMSIRDFSTFFFNHNFTELF